MAASPALLAQALGQQTRPAAASSADPYANGISFGGSTVQPVWNAATGTWGIPAGGGFAPIYNAQQFNSLVSSPNSGNTKLNGMPGENFGISAPEGAATNPFDPGTYQGAEGNTAFQTTSPGQTLAINGNGIKNDIAYKLDPKTGDYVPASMTTEHTAPSFFDNLIKYGAMAGGAIAGGAGVMGLGSAGPGASALGGSADLASGASGAGLTAAEGAGATALPVSAPGAAQTSELAPLSAGGQSFDASGMVQDIGDSAAASSAPQLAADQSAIASQGMRGIAADAANLGASGGSSLLSNKNLVNALQKVVGQAISPGQMGGSPNGGGSASGYGGGSLGGMASGTAGMQPTGFRGGLEGPLSYQGTNPMALAAALKQMLGPQQPHSQYGAY